MAKQKKEEQYTVQDFSKRFPGGEEVAPAGGEWFAFDDVGDELVGEFVGTEPFRNGVKGTLITEEGPVVFSVAKILRQQLAQIKPGQKIAIVLAGFQASDKASPTKIFQVFRVK